MTKQFVFSFEEGDGKNKLLLGGKGANLCEMTQMKLNVPPGFVISTEACLAFQDKKALPDGLMDSVKQYMKDLEKKTNKGFGSPENPLLVSVRSGSAISMPGMMDTILNLGLNAKTLQGLIKQTGNERFGNDAYRRFIQLFGKVALGIADEKFDEPFNEIKKKYGAKADVDLSAEALKEIGDHFLDVVRRETGRPFPEDVYEQLEIAIKAVFGSWMGKRAVDYRREFKITPAIANGTAVNVCTMVFGNMGNDSGTGVGFTRDPGTGENKMYGEYLVNAQGEDVVAGIRTPKAVVEMEKEMPDLYRQLVDLRNKLETHYHEVQDYEYTIEKGILYCLQTRNGKMNAAAMVRTSVEMVNEGLIDKQKAILRINPNDLDQLLHPRLDPNANVTPLAQGLSASPGAASGKAIFDADRAEIVGRQQGEDVILVREETKPEDIHGFFASKGILTSRGGKTSHAAVVARGMGKACVAGAEGIHVDVKLRQAIVGDTVINEGDVITIDGSSGNVYLGPVPTLPPHFSQELKTLLSWADEFATLKVMANADTPDGALKAVEFGAMGIGLCRTERMFNDVDRLPIVVEMILSDTVDARKTALDKLLPIQKNDFKDIFKTMAPRPVTVRLLDPPLHEFLPTEQQLLDDLANLRQLKATSQGMVSLITSLRMLNREMTQLGSPFDEEGADMVTEVIAKKEQMLRKVRELFEVNPMLGHRGVRLGITYPEIYDMQIRAILEASAECIKEGVDIHPEVMIPQVCTAHELMKVKESIDKIKAEVEQKTGADLSRVKFGTMIEVVRACMRASELAKVAEFFSFGTNDLTQATFSFSREDAENKFLPFYNEKVVLQDNPFEVLDVKGVGQLMKLAVQNGRGSRSDLKVGICGEQGGHPDSIRFCHYVGLTYVSCSGPRVPIARLAAAQAKLLESQYKE
jgi:pyruvate,orthophosphate dikinase